MKGLSYVQSFFNVNIIKKGVQQYQVLNRLKDMVLN